MLQSYFISLYLLVLYIHWYLLCTISASAEKTWYHDDIDETTVHNAENDGEHYLQYY